MSHIVEWLRSHADTWYGDKMLEAAAAIKRLEEREEALCQGQQTLRADIERLRAHPGPDDSVTVQFRTMVEQRHEAAAEIERLMAANELLQTDRNRWREMWGTTDADNARLRAENERLLVPLGLRNEIERLTAALQSLLTDPPATLDEPDTDAEVIIKMRDIARCALEPKL